MTMWDGLILLRRGSSGRSAVMNVEVSIKVCVGGGEFIKLLNNCQRIRKDRAPWS